jgi:hypothetical protein
VGSCDDDTTGSDADAVLSGLSQLSKELASPGLADCLGSGKASSRSWTSLSAALQYIYPKKKKKRFSNPHSHQQKQDTPFQICFFEFRTPLSLQ